MTGHEDIKTQPNSATIHYVISRDGTKIGYRQYGKGKGLVLVQGTMGSIENFRQLAEELANEFTVYVAERRGRGISGSTGKNYSIRTEVEDLDALLVRTGAHYVYGLSSGAIISLQAALKLPSIKRLAVFEPPLFINNTFPKELVDRYENEIAEGKVAAALVSAMLAGQFGPPAMKFMPRWLLIAFTKKILSAEEKEGSGAYIPMKDIASTLHNDFQIVEAMNEKLQTFKDIKVKLLLLSGDKSPTYLQTAVAGLAKLLPQAEYIILPGLGHSASWNFDKQRNPDGDPKVVAEKLRYFFSASSR
ncbi:MAG TPA: alpha/beta fold hydrolase [Candidatus Sulfotelmatobacter sp.]|nr:alpha/beta fold hydrolase [Candidatus Sulfotelmatobacter sp.]